MRTARIQKNAHKGTKAEAFSVSISKSGQNFKPGNALTTYCCTLKNELQANGFAITTIATCGTTWEDLKKIE